MLRILLLLVVLSLGELNITVLLLCMRAMGPRPTLRLPATYDWRTLHWSDPLPQIGNKEHQK